MLFQTRENYPNPDAKAEAQATKVENCREKAKKQQQKEREQAEDETTNVEIAKKREASIKLYKEFLKKRIAWNAKVQGRSTRLPPRA